MAEYAINTFQAVGAPPAKIVVRAPVNPGAPSCPNGQCQVRPTPSVPIQQPQYRQPAHRYYVAPSYGNCANGQCGVRGYYRISPQYYRR
jgi:hypothetical protein